METSTSQLALLACRWLASAFLKSVSTGLVRRATPIDVGCSSRENTSSRDEYRGSLQIVYGLLCDREGRPVAVEVFEGNTLVHPTVLAQIEKLKSRFELSRVVFVSDRAW
jgi:hypothetical protein